MNKRKQTPSSLCAQAYAQTDGAFIYFELKRK
uniref:Uncharacterized protein n=1 Tax=Siphoviridae sp. ctBCr48 TaxID=2827802 RepID=A0A8S5SHU2_9CAUD|nr:MAG TPA: hypothetical protein [Siphoviridae sp. ctBCr48]